MKCIIYLSPLLSVGAGSGARSFWPYPDRSRFGGTICHGDWGLLHKHQIDPWFGAVTDPAILPLILCENPCEKKVPKPAKTCKIDKNVKNLNIMVSICYLNFGRLGSSRDLSTNP